MEKQVCSLTRGALANSFSITCSHHWGRPTTSLPISKWSPSCHSCSNPLIRLPNRHTMVSKSSRSTQQETSREANSKTIDRSMLNCWFQIHETSCSALSHKIISRKIQPNRSYKLLTNLVVGFEISPFVSFLMQMKTPTVLSTKRLKTWIPLSESILPFKGAIFGSKNTRTTRLSSKALVSDH